MTTTTGELAGTQGRLATTTWPHPDPTHVVLLAHGYGEHVGRYPHVAAALGEHGAVVHGLDHLGHGRSDGERVVVSDVEDVVTDLRTLAEDAAAQHPGLPVVLLGHSMGGLIAARYAQRYPGELTALVLSGPVLGRWHAVEQLLAMAEIPDAPLDISTLSRDPAVGLDYAADDQVWHGPFRRTTLLALQAGIDAVAAGPDLGSLPTLWAHGEDDQLVPIEATRTGVAHLRGPAWEEIVYPGARHEILNETNREEVLADVTGFVDRALGR